MGVPEVPSAPLLDLTELLSHGSWVSEALFSNSPGDMGRQQRQVQTGQADAKQACGARRARREHPHSPSRRGPRVLLVTPPAAGPWYTTPTLLTAHSLLNFIFCCSLFAHCSEINAGAHITFCF